MDSKLPELRLTPEEISCMARIVGANIVIGIGDPFFGWLAEEVYEAWDKAIDTLAEKRYLRRDDKGTVLLDTIIGMIMKCYFRPEASYLAYKKMGTSPGELRVFHLTRQFSVEQTYPEANGREILISAYEGIKPINNRILEFLDLRDPEHEASIDISLRMKSLWRVITAKEKEPKSIPGIMENLGLSEKESEYLTKTIEASCYLSNLIGAKFRGGTWQINGISFLGSKEYLWRMIPEFGEKKIMLRMNTFTLQEAIEEAKEYMQGMVPILT